MSSKRVFAGLFSILVVMSAVAAPQAAAAAACQYNRQDLPIPANMSHATTRGSSTNNSRIVGVATRIYERGVIWVNGTARVMADPNTLSTSVWPNAVNNTSVVAGAQEIYANGLFSYKAFRYENNAYELLPTGQGLYSQATGINDAGDVVGIEWQNSLLDTTVVLWPRNGARKEFGKGRPVGITAQGKIAVMTDAAPVLIDTVSGTRTELVGGRSPVVLDNDRVLTGSTLRSEITEWDLDGVRVGGHNDGVTPLGRNNSGTVYGTLHRWEGPPTLWRPSGRTEVVADQLPVGSYYGDVTDAATLIGTYVDSNNEPHPARWLWVCS